MSSKRFQLNKEEWMKILRVFAWSVASALVAGLVAVLSSGDLPQQVLIYVPIANAFLYGVSKWLQDNK